jgi:hypothetical protein
VLAADDVPAAEDIPKAEDLSAAEGVIGNGVDSVAKVAVITFPL